MFKSTLNDIQCPNTGSVNLQIFGIVVNRSGDYIENLEYNNLESNDDIKEGIIFDEASNFIYPIENYIPFLLSVGDATDKMLEILKKFSKYNLNENLKTKLNNLISIIVQNEKNDINKWNNEEANYYDNGHDSDEQINQDIFHVKSFPLWSRYLTPDEVIFGTLREKKIKNLLEIGAGNCRSVYHLFNPKKYNYKFIGTDMSYNRLRVAKNIMPSSDFIVCSALNLPFTSSKFDAAIALGALHHMPSLEKSITECARCLVSSGYFGFNEPVEKPQIFKEGGFFDNYFSTYEHSEHDNDINLEDTNRILHDNNIYTIAKKKHGSNIFGFILMLFSKVNSKLLYNKTFSKCLNFFEKIYLFTLGKVLRPFGLGYSAYAFIGLKKA